MQKLMKSIFLIFFILFFGAAFVLAEEITITTYYPSPYGSYNSLQTDKLGVGDNNDDGAWTSADVPTTSGDAWIKGKVGIGTITPVALSKLTVTDPANSTMVVQSGSGFNASLDFYSDNWSTWSIGNRNTVLGQDFYIEEPDQPLATRTRFAIRGGTGNVGIGTVNPAAELHIYKGRTPELRIETSDPTGVADIHVLAGTTNWGFGAAGDSYGGSLDKKFYISDQNAAPGGAARLVIDNAGNVGIGTKTPSSNFHILGRNVPGEGAELRVQTQTNISADIHLQNPVKQYALICKGTGSGADANKFIIEDNTLGLSRLAIDTNGKIGIGTTSPTYQLQLSTDSAAKPATNLWSIASDKRIKKNISDFTDGLNIVMKLKPHTYQYNGLGGKGYDDTNSHIGFIAQEVEPIAPYMIETGKGTIDGAPVEDFKSYQGHALSFILVNAIQEQQEIIKVQQLQIDGLKARLDKLEGK